MTVIEAAAGLGLAPYTVRQKCNKGKIAPAYKAGRAWVIEPSAIPAYRNRRRARGANAPTRALERAKPVSGLKPGRARKTPKGKTPGGRRGKVKELLLAELESAGKAGVKVKDLASKLGLKAQNLHVWFNTTGKKVGVKRIGPGVYRL